MPLAASDKVGRYEILALIGKGGMGEVYKAHDPAAGRDVAVKISHAQFSNRFSREARAPVERKSAATLMLGENWTALLKKK
jgi:serine/threonine protein kinase